MPEPTDADDIIVFPAISADLTVDIFLVGDFNSTGVDLAMLPEISKTSAVEAVSKPANVASWIAKYKPNNLGVAVGESSIGGFPRISW